MKILNLQVVNPAPMFDVQAAGRRTVWNRTLGRLAPVITAAHNARKQVLAANTCPKDHDPKAKCDVCAENGRESWRIYRTVLDRELRAQCPPAECGHCGETRHKLSADDIATKPAIQIVAAWRQMTSHMLVHWKKDTGWPDPKHDRPLGDIGVGPGVTARLADCEAWGLQQAVNDVYTAVDRHLRPPTGNPRRHGWPRFKKWSDDQAFCVNAAGAQFVAETGRIVTVRIPKLGDVQLRGTHSKGRYAETLATLKGRVTLKQRSGQWWASFVIPTEDPVPLDPAGAVPVGVDTGIARVAVASDPAIRPLEPGSGLTHRQTARIRVLERSIARAHHHNSPDCFNADGVHVTGGCGWRPSKTARKKQAEIARLRRLERNAADHDSRWFASKVAEKHPFVAVADYGIQDFARKEHGQRNRNRLVLAGRPGTVRRHLEEAAEKQGGAVVSVPFNNASLRCHRCGQEGKQDRRQFTCLNIACETGAIDIDRNAARNIAAAGKAELADQVETQQTKAAAAAKRKQARIEGKKAAARKAADEIGVGV